LLEHEFGGNKELVLFFLSWLQHNRNATKAYKFLHPDRADNSCRVLGSRMLAKVNIKTIMESYGLGIATYIRQLKKGLKATKMVSIGMNVYEEMPDHKTRRAYHEALGKILGIESGGNDYKDTVVPIQINNIINSKKDNYGI
jgi:hypothetical protein